MAQCADHVEINNMITKEQIIEALFSDKVMTQDQMVEDLMIEVLGDEFVDDFLNNEKPISYQDLFKLMKGMFDKLNNITNDPNYIRGYNQAKLIFQAVGGNHLDFTKESSRFKRGWLAYCSEIL